MKKILALALALMLCLCSVAFADEAAGETTTVDTTGWKSAANTQALNLKKVYTVTGATDSALYPAETLTFSVDGVDGYTNPDTTEITVDPLVVKGNANQVINIQLPEYTKVGVYKYVISENEGKTQGVGYTTAKIAVTVLVEYDYTNKCLKSSIVLSTNKEESGDGADGKEDTFTNTYDVGTLTVKKTVSGNLASTDAYFTMEVELKAKEIVLSDITVSGGSNDGNPTKILASDWTGNDTDGYTAKKTIYLRANETLTFVNIPAGVTYTVNEDDSHAAEDTTGTDASKGYTVSGEVTTHGDAIAKGETDSVVVNNEKSTTISTGIALDNAPYMIVLALVVVAGVMMMKKRSYNA